MVAILFDYPPTNVPRAEESTDGHYSKHYSSLEMSADNRTQIVVNMDIVNTLMDTVRSF